MPSPLASTGQGAVKVSAFSRVSTTAAPRATSISRQRNATSRLNSASDSISLPVAGSVSTAPISPLGPCPGSSPMRLPLRGRRGLASTTCGVGVEGASTPGIAGEVETGYGWAAALGVAVRRADPRPSTEVGVRIVEGGENARPDLHATMLATINSASTDSRKYEPGKPDLRALLDALGFEPDPGVTGFLSGVLESTAIFLREVALR